LAEAKVVINGDFPPNREKQLTRASSSIESMSEWMNQARAASHIRELLIQRGLDIPSRRVRLAADQEWVIFERNERQLGVDAASGIWLRNSVNEEWRCVAMSHTMSGAIIAADFLKED